MPACFRPAVFLTLAIGLALPVVGAPSMEQLNGTLRFEPNAGQADERVSFIVRGRDAAAYLTNEGAVLDLRGNEGERVGLRFRPVGAEAAPCTEGLDELVTRVSYFRGSDPSKWVRNLRTYGSVAQRDIYPGIDLVHRGTEGRLEYDFVIAPAADPRVVRVAIDGAVALQLDAAGNLLIDTAIGRIAQRAPVAYQEIAGLRHEVAARCLVLGPSEIGFELGAYDTSRELVIDPLVYSTFLGGATGPATGADGWPGRERAFDVKVDGQGNAHVVGWTRSSDFPTTAGAFRLDMGSSWGADFVSKFSASGELLWSSYLDRGEEPASVGAFKADASLALEPGGDVYVCSFAGPGAATTTGAYDTAFNGNSQGPFKADAYLAKLDSSGSELLVGTYFGGAGSDGCAGLALDSSGNAVIVGYTESPDFPTTSGAADSSLGGSHDIFMARLDSTGSSLLYSTYLGGSGNDDTDFWGGSNVVVDAAGATYLTGTTLSSDYPTTPGAFDRTYNAGRDVVVTKVSAAGALAYSTYLGGSSDDYLAAIRVDASGQAVISGSTGSRNFPTTRGAYDTSWSGGDAFVTKLNANGSGLVFSTFLGGRDSDSANALDLTATGEVLVTGYTQGNFPTTASAFDSTYNGGAFDGFVSRLNAAGSSLTYSTYLGGALYDRGLAIAAVTSTRGCIVGETFSDNYPTFNAYDGVLGGDSDAFVTMLDF